MGGGEEEEEEEEGGQERLRRKRDGRGRGEDKHELYSQCPALFSGILPQSEGIEDFNEDDEDVKSDDQRRETD